MVPTDAFTTSSISLSGTSKFATILYVSPGIRHPRRITQPSLNPVTAVGAISERDPSVLSSCPPSSVHCPLQPPLLYDVESKWIVIRPGWPQFRWRNSCAPSDLTCKPQPLFSSHSPRNSGLPFAPNYTPLRSACPRKSQKNKLHSPGKLPPDDSVHASFCAFASGASLAYRPAVS